MAALACSRREIRNRQPSEAPTVKYDSIPTSRRRFEIVNHLRHRRSNTAPYLLLGRSFGTVNHRRHRRSSTTPIPTPACLIYKSRAAHPQQLRTSCGRGFFPPGQNGAKTPTKNASSLGHPVTCQRREPCAVLSVCIPRYMHTWAQSSHVLEFLGSTFTVRRFPETSTFTREDCDPGSKSAVTDGHKGEEERGGGTEMVKMTKIQAHRRKDGERNEKTAGIRYRSFWSCKTYAHNTIMCSCRI